MESSIVPTYPSPLSRENVTFLYLDALDLANTVGRMPALIVAEDDELDGVGPELGRTSGGIGDSFISIERKMNPRPYLDAPVR